jgi:hypothetical protein
MASNRRPHAKRLSADGLARNQRTETPQLGLPVPQRPMQILMVVGESSPPAVGRAGGVSTTRRATNTGANNKVAEPTPSPDPYSGVGIP